MKKLLCDDEQQSYANDEKLEIGSHVPALLNTLWNDK